MQQSHTPSTVSIQPRNRHFDIADALTRDWFDNNAFITAWHNSLSITFPLGEKFFIDSVRHFADQIEDEKLKSEISGFCGQEGFHRREHELYNETLCNARGYDLELLEGRVATRLAFARKRFDPMTQLAITVALEHITAVMAEFHLRDDSPFRGKPEKVMEELWHWHGAEELEHKAVAFDVYRAMNGTEKMRKAALRRASVLIVWRALTGAMHMFRKDGLLFSWKVWKQGATFLLGRQGLFRSIWPSYKQFFQPDFHPWQIDTRDILNDWEAGQLSAV